MVNKLEALASQNPTMVYQIRIQGYLERQRTEWFEDMSITQTSNGETLLTGPVVDQAALHGLLRKVRDLGLPLIAVGQVQPDQAYSTPSS